MSDAASWLGASRTRLRSLDGTHCQHKGVAKRRPQVLASFRNDLALLQLQVKSLPGYHLRFLVRTLPVLPRVISTSENSKQTQILNLGAVLIAWPNVTCPRWAFFLQLLLPSLSTSSVSWAVPRCRARNTRERQRKSARCSVFLIPYTSLGRAARPQLQCPYRQVCANFAKHTTRWRLFSLGCMHPGLKNAKISPSLQLSSS